MKVEGCGSFRLNPADAGSLPDSPGVYLFLDEGEKVLYVGKALSLRRRVKSYFTGSQPGNPRLAQLRRTVRYIDCMVTANQMEALLLENNLIKTLKPAFNILLRDDKTYPYIAVTVKDTYPRFFLHRGERQVGIEYYGPYPNASAARETLDVLRKAYPFRTCRGPSPGKGRRGPCLDRHIGLCPGPCKNRVSVDDYRRNVRMVQRFLSGKGSELLDELETKMRKEADNQEFEMAARTRDILTSLRRISERQSVIRADNDDIDALGLSADELDACITVLMVRSGRLTGKRDFIFQLPPEDDPGGVIASFIEAYYDEAISVPARILVPCDLGEDATKYLSQWLRDKRGRRVELRCPRRGELRELLLRAEENAVNRLRMAKLKRAADLQWISEAVNTLRRELLLEIMPYRIECYDISNLGTSHVVGSMVVFEGGVPQKKDYRRFSLRGELADDSSRIYEVISRRLSKLAEAPPECRSKASGAGEHPRLTSFQKKPDLLLVDGGRSQLSSALRAVREAGIEGIEVAALAKKLEYVYRPGQRDPLIIPKDSTALYFLQRVRDEAHRFAIDYHRELRDRGTRESRLDHIRGIGKARKIRLLEVYGSVDRIKRASLEELASLPFMDRSSACELFRSLQGDVS